MGEPRRIVFTIRGLTCASCAFDVSRALRKVLPGIVDVNINYMVERGYVELDPSQVSWDRVAAVLGARGYTVVPVG